MPIIFGDTQVELNSPQLGVLRDCNELLDSGEQLCKRLDEDGYLLIRGLHDREKVLNARRAIFQSIQPTGCLDESCDLMDGKIKLGSQAPDMFSNRKITHHPAVLEVLQGKPIFDLFHKIYSKSPRTFDYKWLRAVGHGEATGSHYDVVYMGRGSLNLMTCWTPLGDLDIEQGTLAICVGSHRLPAFEKVRQTYGRSDVDRDHTHGHFSNNPFEVVEKFGGTWKTAHFKAGDVIVFGMFMMHASTQNTTDRWRLSCDTRFQPADEPADERWIGDKPKGHYAQEDEEVVPIEKSRSEWGV